MEGGDVGHGMGGGGGRGCQVFSSIESNIFSPQYHGKCESENLSRLTDYRSHSLESIPS